MAKGRLIITILCLCLMFGMGIKSYAEPVVNTPKLKEQMKEYVEKVKIMNLKKQQEMIQKAGGNITGCPNCHYHVK